MHARSVVTLSVLILALICASFVRAADNICQGCIDDVMHAYPSCSSLDNSKKSDFTNLSTKDKQCICNIGQNPSNLSKCQALCPPSTGFDQVQAVFSGIYSVYCNNTAFANGGQNGATSGSSSSSSVSASIAAIAVIVSISAMIVA